MKSSSYFRLLALASATSCHCLLTPASISSKTNSFGLATTRYSSTKLSFYHDFDSDDDFSMTTSDLARIQAIRDRTLTLPIIIIDSILPGQFLRFTSDDVKFQKLLAHVLEQETEGEIGVIGFNPHTGRPLNIGVTVTVSEGNVEKAIPRGLSIESKGLRRFEVQTEPWLDDSESFYFAKIEIVEDRKEDITETQEEEAEKFFARLPNLVDKWLELLFMSKKCDLDSMRKIMKDIGPMPDNLRERAIWVASLLNPHPNLKVCPEIRPAMLACRNNYERLFLATVSLQSSIDRLLGDRSL